MIVPFYVRLVFAVGALLMIWPALSDTQSALLRSGGEPALAPVFGLQARDQVGINEDRFGDAGRLADSAESVRQNALLALLDDPLEAMTLRQLAYTLLGANRPLTVPLLKLADRTSRRDLLTQISLIEFAVQSGSADQALRHYDRTLTIYPAMSETLFPILAKAANEPDVAQGLRAYLVSPWFRPFLSVALKNGTKPEAVVGFVEAGGIGGQSEGDRQFRLQLLNELVSMQALDAAEHLVLVATPRAGKLLKDPSFSSQTADTALGPFAWRLSHGEPVTATLTEEGWLEAEISSGRSGLIAERVTMLPPSRFTRTLNVEVDSGQASVRLTVEVRCLGTGAGAVLASQELSPLGGADEIAFLVPDGCRAQTWRIMGYGEFGRSSAKVRLSWGIK